MFRKLENAINRAVLTGFLIEKRICNTTMNNITFVASEYDIYKRRRMFGKVGRFCYSLIERKLLT